MTWLIYFKLIKLEVSYPGDDIYHFEECDCLKFACKEHKAVE